MSLVAAVGRHPKFCSVEFFVAWEFTWLSSIGILSPGNGWTPVRQPPSRAGRPPGQAGRPGCHRGGENSGRRHAPQQGASGSSGMLCVLDLSGAYSFGFLSCQFVWNFQRCHCSLVFLLFWLHVDYFVVCSALTRLEMRPFVFCRCS